MYSSTVEHSASGRRSNKSELHPHYRLGLHQVAAELDEEGGEEAVAIYDSMLPAVVPPATEAGPYIADGREPLDGKVSGRKDVLQNEGDQSLISGGKVTTPHRHVENRSVKAQLFSRYGIDAQDKLNVKTL